MMLRRSFLLLALGGFLSIARADRLDPDHPPVGVLPSETKMGDAAVKDFEKDKTTHLLDLSLPANRALQGKLEGMVRAIGKATTRPGIAYTVKIVDNTDINAFTLPGGHVYVFKGLLDFVASDDELAGVLAHELGHNARLHALRGEKQAKKLSWVNLAAMAAMIAGGQNGANVGAFSQFALLGAMNGYGVGLEKEADASAVETMRRAGYNPSALVTFMRRLQVEENHHPDVKLGIFATHPPSDERADAVLTQMGRDGLPFTPREVSGGAQFVLVEKPDRVTVAMNGLTLLEFAPTAGGRARAGQAATRLNALWKNDLKAYELAVSPDGMLSARGETVATPAAEDAQRAGLSPLATAQGWKSNFERLFWRLQLNGKV